MKVILDEGKGKSVTRIDLPEPYVLSLNTGDDIVLHPSNSVESLKVYRVFSKRITFTFYSSNDDEASFAVGTTPIVKLFVKRIS